MKNEKGSQTQYAVFDEEGNYLAAVITEQGEPVEAFEETYRLRLRTKIILGEFPPGAHLRRQVLTWTEWKELVR
jgi:hypothetical protein